MIKTTITGFPRIGQFRELKVATEKYFHQQISEEELLAIGQELRQKHWQEIQKSGITTIPSNDFSFYDTTLDTACLLNIVPEAVNQLPLSLLEKYFAVARGYQGEHGDVKARPMKKWFNTNYHYIVPKIEKTTAIKLVGTKIFDEYKEARDLGIETRPVLLGPFTLLLLSEIEEGVDKEKIVGDIVTAYQSVLQELAKLGASWIQLDEPSLVTDLTQEEIQLFTLLYTTLLQDKPLKVLLQTYFGDVRETYSTLLQLPFEALGLDFVEGKQTLSLVKSGFPTDKLLVAGVVNGKNIWRNNYEQTIELLRQLPTNQWLLSTSCSLLHVPYSTEQENLPEESLAHLSFAKEKLSEINELACIFNKKEERLAEKNKLLFRKTRFDTNEAVIAKVAQLTEADFVRTPSFEDRRIRQHTTFQFPALPTTTIGSFPQTREVKQLRAKYRKNEVSSESYELFIANQINDWIEWQEEVGFDVLVHGEFERNDMVEYFGQHLSGYLFTQNGWVQSYGTRGVKPPIIWGDIERKEAITVKWSKYAQSQTDKWVKGMLTGPVTILNWSFPREDISLKDTAFQLALAIREEVLELEKNNIRIIQIDEAALREKLPLRKSDWYSDYLDWAIPAFRLVHSRVEPTTQIHTHMCYSEFTDIIPAIDQMDADVISFEASRSNLDILDDLVKNQFKTAVGPGVYDIHSPRVPTVEEIQETIGFILSKVPYENVWINPDCGLKTRGIQETRASLTHMILAAKSYRKDRYL